ncbi:hypothetical protein SLA2020_412160 [Shorea laevis]
MRVWVQWSLLYKNRAAFHFLLICAQFSHKHHLCLSLRILLRLLSFCVAKHFRIRTEFNCASHLFLSL